MPKCPRCQRRFRSKAAQELAEKRHAVILDLSGVEPAEHLRPPQTIPEPDRHTRHIQHRKDWLAGLN